MTDSNALRAVAPAEPDPVQERIKEVRRQRDELRERRAAANEQREAANQLEDEERQLRDEQAIAAAEEQHGEVGRKIAVVQTDLGVVIVKRSHPNLFRRFQEKGTSSDGELKLTEIDKLVRPALVYPSGAEFDRICDDLPATPLRCANAISILAGVRAKENVGK
jgi:hypothetical protein